VCQFHNELSREGCSGVILTSRDRVSGRDDVFWRENITWIFPSRGDDLFTFFVQALDTWSSHVRQIGAFLAQFRAGLARIVPGAANFVSATSIAGLDGAFALRLPVAVTMQLFVALENIGSRKLEVADLT
jgi:hypothetical protein